MKNPIKRIKSFRENIEWLSKITGTKKDAAKYLIATKIKKRKPLGEGKYAHLPIFFRRNDLTALREVLVDEEYAFLKPYVTTNHLMNVFDIGAHIGTFALWMLGQNAQADIYSLEADPDTFAILKKNREPAAHYGHAWRVINRAAWKEEAVLTFSNAGDSMSHKLSEKGTIKVLGVTMEKLIEMSKYENIHLMKIDIEGAEEAFLTANPDLLKRIEMLVIEIHPKQCNEKAIRALLAENYNVVEEIQGRKSSKPLLFCRKYG
ncbi:MAG: FkbM family methyltransferase [Alphaproteobacteria bacterium]|nr:FkbM family methyltransferase [Alphaproteobacteria bacterium]MCB9974672.1 FkbM family methyltransferase [Rhodospirillales bacterium]